MLHDRLKELREHNDNFVKKLNDQHKEAMQEKEEQSVKEIGKIQANYETSTRKRIRSNREIKSWMQKNKNFSELTSKQWNMKQKHGKRENRNCLKQTNRL